MRAARTTTRRARVLGALAVVAFGACAKVHRPPGDLESVQASGDVVRDTQRAIKARLVEALAQRVVVRGDSTLDVLLLSGGGQHGAYGIGFLRGWRARPDQPMPRFDLVTGISTGALQAPFALLGSQAALDEAAALYRDAADRLAPSVDLLFWLRRTGGVVDASRFQRGVRAAIDADLRDRLRAEFQVGRRIAIGTCDLDLGIGRVWDLGVEMDSPAGLERVYDLLFAASAIPGIFPPILLDGHVHVDGGVVANLLPVLDLDDYRALAEHLRAAGVQGTVTVRTWVVMNLWLHAQPQLTNPSKVDEIARRASTLLFWTQQPQLLERLVDLAEAVTTGVPGLRMQLRCTAVPSELASEPSAYKLFDREWMTRLEQLGYERALGAAPWDAIGSAYERPARAPAGATRP